MKMHVMIFFAGTILALDQSIVFAQGFGIFVPPDSSFQDANSSTLQPFSVASSRYQQLYGLQGIFARDVYISSIVFRLDGTNGSTINGQMAGLQVRMSTTPLAVDSLSPVYANNVGPDQMLVFSGAVQWFSNYVPGSQFPQALDLRINFQQPFLYSPSQSNLLVDITVAGTSIFAQLDAWNRASDSVSSVFGSSFSTTGTESTLGLVTYFAGTAVPEPAPFAIAFVGFVIFFLMHRIFKSPTP